MAPSTYPWLGLAVALIGASSVALAARRWRGAAGAPHLVAAMAGVAASTLLAAPIVGRRAQASSFFATAHLAFFVVWFALPAVGLALLVLIARRGRTGIVVPAIAVVLLAPAPLGWYALGVAPHRVHVEEVAVVVPDERVGADPIRIGVLADLQADRITGHEERAVELLLAEEPDLIVLTGDLFQGSDDRFAEQAPAFRSLLGRLRAPGGVYAVPGDTDTGDRLEVLTKGTGVRVLENEIVALAIGDRRVDLAGNGLLWAGVVPRAMRTELTEADPGVVRVLVAHRPDVVLSLPSSADIDVTIAGHTHAGQVALPLIGPLVTFSKVPRSVAAGGLHELGGNAIYVSSGVGMVREDAPPIRFLTRPSVGIVELS